MDISKYNELVVKDNELVISLLELGDSSAIVEQNLQSEHADVVTQSGWHVRRRYDIVHMPEKPSVRVTVWTMTISRESVTFEFDDDVGFSPTERQKCGGALKRARSVSDLSKAALGFIEVIRKEHGEEYERLESVVRGNPDLDLSDFWYFSVTTFTTVGSGDILPNNAVSRMLVAAESLFSIFLLAFGVELLWPEAISAKKDDPPMSAASASMRAPT